MRIGVVARKGKNNRQPFIGSFGRETRKYRRQKTYPAILCPKIRRGRFRQAGSSFLNLWCHQVRTTLVWENRGWNLRSLDMDVMVGISMGLWTIYRVIDEAVRFPC